MATRPDKFPEFALDDVVDSVSGQPNVSEPPSELKNSGWIRKQKPPRQYFNWLHRLTHNWLKYLDEREEYPLSGSFDIECHGGDTVVTRENNGYYIANSKVAFVCIKFTQWDINGTSGIKISGIPTDAVAPSSMEPSFHVQAIYHDTSQGIVHKPLLVREADTEIVFTTMEGEGAQYNGEECTFNVRSFTYTVLKQ